MKKGFSKKGQAPSERPDDVQMKPISAIQAAKILWQRIRGQKREARSEGKKALLIFHARSSNHEKLKNAELALYTLLCTKKQNPFFEKVKKGESCFRPRKRAIYRLMIPL